VELVNAWLAEVRSRASYSEHSPGDDLSFDPDPVPQDNHLQFPADGILAQEMVNAVDHCGSVGQTRATMI
jgi:hypothetical protein